MQKIGVGHKTVYEIDPWCHLKKNIFPLNVYTTSSLSPLPVSKSEVFLSFFLFKMFDIRTNLDWMSIWMPKIPTVLFLLNNFFFISFQGRNSRVIFLEPFQIVTLKISKKFKTFLSFFEACWTVCRVLIVRKENFYMKQSSLLISLQLFTNITKYNI